MRLCRTQQSFRARLTPKPWPDSRWCANEFLIAEAKSGLWGVERCGVPREFRRVAFDWPDIQSRAPPASPWPFGIRASEIAASQHSRRRSEDSNRMGLLAVNSHKAPYRQLRSCRWAPPLSRQAAGAADPPGLNSGHAFMHQPAGQTNRNAHRARCAIMGLDPKLINGLASTFLAFPELQRGR